MIGHDGKTGSAKVNVPAESTDLAYKQILNGGGGMPSFSKLSDQEVANVWAHVQTLK